MSAKELAKAGQLPTARGITHTVPIPAVAGADSTVTVTVTIVLVPIVAIFLPHEGIRVLLELFADSRMVLQILLQFRMLFDEVLVIDQRRILAELLGNFRMAVQELVHFCHLSAGRVVVTLILRRHGLRRHRLLALSRRRLSACWGASPEQQSESKQRHERSAGVEASRFDCLIHKNLL